ncbi:MAG: hypothetical protein ABEK50_02410 [bacterium]
MDEQASHNVLSSQELSKQFEQRPDEASTKFLDEQLTVKGEISRIDNVISAVVPRMKGTGDKYSGVHLKFHLKNRQDSKQLSEGDEAILQGVCKNFEKSTSPTGEEIGWITITQASTVRDN